MRMPAVDVWYTPHGLAVCSVQQANWCMTTASLLLGVCRQGHYRCVSGQDCLVTCFRVCRPQPVEARPNSDVLHHHSHSSRCFVSNAGARLSWKFDMVTILRTCR